ncbi:hypothetical protein KI387_009695, partial [Taxus chinensis]
VDLVAKINLGDVVNGRISEVQAAEFIHNRLERKKSLIVLDDLLSEEDSWELLCDFSFSDCEQNQPTHELEKITSKIEEKCKILPLVVKTMVASLTGKTSSRDWESKLCETRE